MDDRSADPRQRAEELLKQTAARRQFFGTCGLGLGSMALAELEAPSAFGATTVGPTTGDAPGLAPRDPDRPLAPRAGHHAPKAKRVIFLFMCGGPSQIDLFDDKPKLREYHGRPLPESFTKGKRFAFIKADANVVGSKRKFARHGASGAEISSLLPHLAGVADDLAIVKSLRTDVFNHGPAKVFLSTGSPRFGRPGMGAWVAYGLGSEAADLPGFVVLQSGPRGPRGGTSIYSSGFLPTTYQGVPFQNGAEPILNLASPSGVDPRRQRGVVDAVNALNAERLAVTGDGEITTRMAAYEMAFRMQSSAPELVDLTGETKETLDLYGVDPAKPSFARNCLLARRLVERGVRFIQLFHTDWDHHGGAGLNLD
ncbi:MAG: DUF1501 domain-containing protein, partial [Planctomycetia bacterium]